MFFLAVRNLAFPYYLGQISSFTSHRHTGVIIIFHGGYWGSNYSHQPGCPRTRLVISRSVEIFTKPYKLTTFT